MSDLFMTPSEVNDNDDTYELIIPSSFKDALSYQQQIIWLYLHKQNNLVEGDNITLTENADGTVTISATGGGSGSTYRIDEVEPDEGYVAAYALIDIATGTQSGETIQIPEGGQGPQGDPGVGIDTIVGDVGSTGTTVTVTLTDGTTQDFFVQRGVQGVPGQNGSDGRDGSDGTDGVSPEVSLTAITGGTRITITDADHPQGQSFDVMDGVDGQNGAPGQPGADGVTPNISAAATVGTGTGTPSVQVTKSGTTAAPEFTFAFDGLKGAQGVPGQNGQDGSDGVSPTVTVSQRVYGWHITIVSAGGTEEFDVYNGTDGQDGTDGVSPTVTVRSITGGHQIEIVSAGGTERFDVMDGVDGQDGNDGSAATIQVGTVTTGQPGTNASVTNSGTSSAAVFDFTIPAGATGSQGPAGPGVPTGGYAGQVLSKVDSTDYNTHWITPQSGSSVSVLERSIRVDSFSPSCNLYKLAISSADDGSTSLTASVSAGNIRLVLRELVAGSTRFAYMFRGSYGSWSSGGYPSQQNNWPRVGYVKVDASQGSSVNFDKAYRIKLKGSIAIDDATVRNTLSLLVNNGYQISGPVAIGATNSSGVDTYELLDGVGTWRAYSHYQSGELTSIIFEISAIFQANLYSKGTLWINLV